MHEGRTWNAWNGLNDLSKLTAVLYQRFISTRALFVDVESYRLNKLDECNTLWAEPSQAAVSATPTA